MRRLLVALVAVSALTVSLPAGSGAQSTPGIDEARAAAQAALEELDAAESRMGELDVEIADLEDRRDQLEAELAALRDQVQAVAVAQYTTRGGAEVTATDPNVQARADALAGIVSQAEEDAVDVYRDRLEELGRAEESLAERKGEHADLLAYFEVRQEQLEGHLEQLQDAERQRQQELAEQRAAEERRAVAISGGAWTGPITITRGAGIVCPVPGAVFRNSWGEPRSGGRAHKGVDMMAPTGAPIPAPASGTVRHSSSGLGGLDWTLAGDDGNSYYGAHLSARGASGYVSAGTVIGYVGETGNAVGAHLHFEIKVGGVSVNPYPYVAAAC